MAELSKVQTRTPLRDKQLGRRDAILPTRRNQQQVRTEMSADMRTARRGDVGGAEALMRVAGQVNKAGRDFQAYDNTRWEENERKLSQQGSVDVATDNVDEELAQENASYNRAVQLGRVRKRLADVLPKTEGAVAEALANSEGLSLEERQAAVDAAVSGVFEGSLIDEEGNLIDFGTAEANVYAANKLTSVRAQAAESGYRQARLQMDEESIDAAANAVAEAVLDGEEVSSELFEAHLTPTADRDTARAQAFRTLETLATADPERAAPALEKLLEDVEGGNGSGFFDAADQVTILALSEKADNALEIKREKERKERHEANHLEMTRTLMDGKLTNQAVFEAVDSGAISSTMGRSFQLAIRSDEAARRAEARAAQAARNDALRTQLAINAQRTGMEVAYATMRFKSGDDTASIEAAYQWQRDMEAQGLNPTAGQVYQIFGAINEGRALARENPDYVQYSGILSNNYGPRQGTPPALVTPQEKANAVRAQQTFDMFYSRTGSAVEAYNKTEEAMRRTPAGDDSSGFDPDEAQARFNELRAKANN